MWKAPFPRKVVLNCVSMENCALACRHVTILHYYIQVCRHEVILHYNVLACRHKILLHYYALACKHVVILHYFLGINTMGSAV